MNNDRKIKRILFVQHELKDWKTARMWGYNFHIGLEEGLESNEVQVTTLLSSWFPVARRLCADKQFDQVWINDTMDMFGPTKWCYYHLTKRDLEWLASLAPIRLGFVVESLKYSGKDYAEWPSLLNYPEILKRTLPYLTHVMACDENDMEYIRGMCNIPVVWFVPSIPDYAISRDISLPPAIKPIFRGTLYGERAMWLKMPLIKELLGHRLTSDNDTDLPEIFDSLHRYLYPQAIRSDKELNKLYELYLNTIREIRRQAFDMYLNDLRQGSMVVNLPSYAKIFTGRVYEGMAAGRPVIACKCEKRPRMNALFEDNRDILLYPSDQPEMLVEQIKKVLNDPEFGRQIAVNAMHKMVNFHTPKKFVRQILEWIATGREPKYDVVLADNDNSSAKPYQAVDLMPKELLERFELGFRKQLTLLTAFKYALFLLRSKMLEFAQRIETRVRFYVKKSIIILGLGFLLKFRKKLLGSMLKYHNALRRMHRE